jgi:protein-S-isoprenylcysteine O-methyltransferase Ste14
VFLGHCIWFDRRVRGDEVHLAALFGTPYREYAARVKRWVPGVY